MPYLLLIVEPPEWREHRTPEEARRAYEGMQRFAGDLKARGVYRASDSLRPQAEGVRIAVRGGRRSVIDGPFVEAKEIVGGFFLVDCPTKADAIALASGCPATEWGTVEVREVGPCWDGA